MKKFIEFKDFNYGHRIAVNADHVTKVMQDGQSCIVCLTGDRFVAVREDFTTVLSRLNGGEEQ